MSSFSTITGTGEADQDNAWQDPRARKLFADLARGDTSSHDELSTAIHDDAERMLTMLTQ